MIFNIGKINWKDAAQNLFISLVSIAFGAFLGYLASTKSNKSTLAAVIPTIEKAIDKETIKNEIKNEIQIDKIKKSDSLKIVMKPDNNQRPVNIISKDPNCVDISGLSEVRQARIRRWVGN